MKPVLTLEVASDSLECIRADVLVIGVAPTDRPLRGAAGCADWRLCGRLWKLVSSGQILGMRGQASLVIPGGGLEARLLLVLGLGPRRSLDLSAWQEIGRDATDRSLGLRAETVAFAIVQDGLIDRPTAHQEFAEAVAGLISGAAHAVLARDACMRLALPGPSVAVIEHASVPAGVEVRLPRSTLPTKLPSAPSGPRAADSRRAQRNSPAR